MNILINGSKLTVEAEELSYEEVCELAKKATNVTITYYAKLPGDASRNGSLIKGQKVKLAEGMVINAVYTGSA